MEPIGIFAVVAIAVTASWLLYIVKCRSTFPKLPGLSPKIAKSPSGESLNTMVNTDDPTQVAS